MTGDCPFCGEWCRFEIEKACFDHINQNYNALQGYVEHYYKQKATVSEIRCVEDGKR